MAADFTERERAFIDSLTADTGQGLDGWMAEIGQSGLSHRNDVIDWLRQRGFTFSRASWLERIHHNGGRLIYGEAAAKTTPAERRPATTSAMTTKPKPKGTSNLGAVSDGEVDALLASAKAYRPLAQVVLRDILAATPGAEIGIVAGHIVIRFDHPFAAIVPTPREVRLLLALGAGATPDGWEKAKLPVGTVEKLHRLTHMILLTDARQVTGRLRDLVAESVENCRE